MEEVFTTIIDRRGRPGRTEKFVHIQVIALGEFTEVDWSLLDKTGKRDLAKYAKEGEYTAQAGIATIAWKSIQDRLACIKDYHRDPKRRNRWQGVLQYVERIRNNEFPQFAHAYLHPSLTGSEGLVVIDGTRRMLAYLESGRTEMPVIIFRAK